MEKSMKKREILSELQAGVQTSKNQTDILNEITDRLEQGILEVFESKRYKEYLRVMSKFHNYSFNNIMLIAMQKPDASLVAGFNAWKNSHGRTVKKGEKGIRIIAPAPYKIKREIEKFDAKTNMPLIGADGKVLTEEKEITITAYKVVSVFDVSQTEGKELPSIGVNELTGGVSQYEDFFVALSKTSPVPITIEHIEGKAKGYYNLVEKRIVIDDNISELQTLKTAIHEIAHAKLHNIDPKAPKGAQLSIDRSTSEVEAESIAYIVCQHYGLDTSDYSFGYIAGWSSGRELIELKNSLEIIRSTAADIINSIDGYIAEIQKKYDKEQGGEQLTVAERVHPNEESVYKVRFNPYSDSLENSYILQEYVFAKGNPAAKMGDAIYIGTQEKCNELIVQLATGELTPGQVKELYVKSNLANVVKVDKDNGKDIKKERKPSILIQLKEAQKNSIQKRHSPKSKNYELEV